MIAELIELLPVLEPKLRVYRAEYHRDIRDLLLAIVTSEKVNAAITDRVISELVNMVGVVTYTLEEQMLILKAPGTETNLVEAFFCIDASAARRPDLILIGMDEGWIKDSTIGLEYLLKVNPHDVERLKIREAIKIHLTVWLRQLIRAVRENSQLSVEQISLLRELKESQMWLAWIERLPRTSKKGLTQTDVYKLLEIASKTN